MVELGCGSGLLTRFLVDAGHRVMATDASPAMLDIAREYVPGAEEIRRLTLPDDPIPEADAVVSVGHALSYLADESSIDCALRRIAAALRPGGVVAFDICDLEWGERRRDQPAKAWVDDDWVLVTRFSVPTPDCYVRQMTVFTRGDDGTWRRDDERHDNVLIDTATFPERFDELGVDATLGSSFGGEELPVGLRTIVGYRRE